MSVVLDSSVAWVHWKEYLSWINKPRVMRLLDRRKKVTLAEHKQYVAKINKDRTQKFFGVYTKSSGEFLGICALKKIDRRNKKAELYICLDDRGGKGNGFGVAAVQELLDYGFKKLKLNRIYLYTPSLNQRAIRCYKKAGFVKEGELLEDVKIGAKYHNSVRMCYLKSFEKKRRKRK